MVRRESRFVAVDTETGEYVSMNCLGYTKDRDSAWSGNQRQSVRMPQVFSLRPTVIIIRECDLDKTWLRMKQKS